MSLLALPPLSEDRTGFRKHARETQGRRGERSRNRLEFGVKMMKNIGEMS